VRTEQQLALLTENDNVKDPEEQGTEMLTRGY